MNLGLFWSIPAIGSTLERFAVQIAAGAPQITLLLETEIVGSARNFHIFNAFMKIAAWHAGS
jgi:hypothetical protein